MRRNWGDANRADAVRRERLERKRIDVVKVIYLCACLVLGALLVLQSSGCADVEDATIGSDGVDPRSLYDQDGRRLRPLRVSALLLHPDENTSTWIDLRSAIVVWLPEEECPICAGLWEDR